MRAIIALLVGLFFAGDLLAQEPILQPGQSFGLRIAGVPNDDQASLSQSYTISDAGTINLLYLAGMKAAGLRPSELARKIETAYRSAQIYSKPNITISLGGGGAERTVSVLGEVNSRRAVTYSPGITMIEAIAQCGGFSDFAYPRKVKLTRGGKFTYHDLSKTTSADNVALQPNDIITVPDTPGLIKRLTDKKG